MTDPWLWLAQTVLISALVFLAATGLALVIMALLWSYVIGSVLVRRLVAWFRR